MRKTKFLFLIAIFGILSSPIHSQTDRLENSEIKSFKLYYSSGIGFGTRGGTFGLGGIFVSSVNWGVSFGYKLNILKNKNVPGDYFDDGRRTFAPRDYLTIVALNLVKEFPASNKSWRFGVEAGPAWVKYNVAQFELNASYDPNTGSWSLFGNYYKYNKSHTASKTIGLALRGKAEFITSPFVAIELAVFANINNIQPVFGIECYVNIGKI